MPAWLIMLGGGRAILAVTIAASAVGAGLWLYLAGREAARIAGLEATITSVETRNDIDRAIDRLPDGAAAERLRRDWTRD